VSGPAVDLGDLGLDRGAHLLLRHALAALPEGGRLAVFGSAPDLQVHLRAFARAEGHAFAPASASEPRDARRQEAGAPLAAHLVRGSAAGARWASAERAGAPGPDGVVAVAPQRWGLAARGAAVEAGGPAFAFALDHKDALWSDKAGEIYRQAAASQWDPATAILWDAPCTHPGLVEDALVQVLTYLVENENAALLVPARFCAQVHPHFQEVLQVLAIQAADEARHVEVFTRRALRHRSQLGLSTVGGQASLKTLLDEPDFALASFLLSVLGEGSFLHLLGFLHVHAPDASTSEIMRLAAQDEARHVAFGMAHLERHAARDPTLRGRLQLAVERRHDALQHTAGLNDEVFDALVLLAAGELTPAAVARGHAAVGELIAQMDAGRQARLRRLGFPEAQAAALSALHTRNFM